MDSHSGMHLSETASVVIHRHRQAVVINRMDYISQRRVKTPSRRGGQFCCSFVVNSLQYLCVKSYQNIMQFDKVIWKIEGCNFFASQCSFRIPNVTAMFRRGLLNGASMHEASMQVGMKNCDFRPISRFISEMIHYNHSYCGTSIGTHTICRFHWVTF